ncbi:MAG: stage V sporulation protein B, partial [Tumebacillaceae bacterium]
LIGFPTSTILTLFANELSNAVFNDPGVGPILAVMAPAGFVLYLQGPLTGILQGINRAGEAMLNSIIGNVLKLIVIYYLVANPKFGIYGVAWSVVISSTLVSILHFLSVSRHLGFYVNLVEMVKIMFATVLMALIMIRLHHQLPGMSNAWLVTICSLGGFLIYFLALNFMRVVTLHTIRRIPKIGPVLAGFLRLVPFIR